MNCGFDSCELDNLFFLESNAYISLSISGSVAGSIPCMLAKNFTGFKQQKIHSYIAISQIWNTQLHHDDQKSAANELLQKRNIPMPMKRLKLTRGRRYKLTLSLPVNNFYWGLNSIINYLWIISLTLSLYVNN